MITETSFLCQYGAISLHTLHMSGKSYFYTINNVVFNHRIFFFVLLAWSVNMAYKIPVCLDYHSQWLCACLHLHYFTLPQSISVFSRRQGERMENYTWDPERFFSFPLADNEVFAISQVFLSLSLPLWKLISGGKSLFWSAHTFKIKFQKKWISFFWLWDVITAPRRLQLWKKKIPIILNIKKKYNSINSIYLILDSDELASFNSVILEYYCINFHYIYLKQCNWLSNYSQK